MMDDRTKLLHSLTIDRSATPSAAPARAWPRWVAGAVALGLLIAGGAWFMLAGGRGEPPNPAASRTAAGTTSTSPAPVTVRPRAVGLTASGYVVARRKATVAAEITGKVVEILVEEGMVVEAGQVVARITSRLAETDLSLSKSRVAAAEAVLAAITAELRDAERIFTRTQSLQQKNFASEADLTRTEARVNVLRAQLGQATAQLETARLEARRFGEVLDQHSVRAPFSGVVVDRSAQPGEMVSPMSAGGSFTRTGICTIVDMDSIEVEVDVNEAFIGRVRKGGAVSAVLDAYPDWTIPAYVIAIVPTANREKATVRVRIGFREKDPRILPDMAVKVVFVEDQPPATAERTSAAQ